MYHVYEIIGDKAGCVRNDQWDVRQRAQRERGEMIIRSTHDCIYEASDAELAFQKLKGYRVDTIPYWKTLEAGLKGAITGGRNGTFEGRSKAGKIGGRASVIKGTNVCF